LPEVPVVGFERVGEAMYALSRNGWFEATGFTAEDAKRRDMYKENALRAGYEKTFKDYDDYLRGLEMKARISDFTPAYLNRITQLTNKSNQFNLTTKRYTLEEMEAVSRAGEYVRLVGKLEDKFGDNGVVSVVIGKRDGDELHMELWLMSCRVLRRGMEYAMLDVLARRCAALGINSVFGYYYKTEKNGMVAGLFQSFGFENVSTGHNGDSVWRLEISGYERRNDIIDVKAVFAEDGQE
jgi:FkbH-like protein